MCDTRTKIERVTGAGGDFETVVTVDKATHELIVPRERETEQTVTVVILAKGAGPSQGSQTEGDARPQ